LCSASRGRLGAEVIDQLLQAAQTSIGVPQAQDVVRNN
jgi:hypothetical protein